MVNIFKNLIKKELGKGTYYRLALMVKEKPDTRFMEPEGLYTDIYESLKNKDTEVLNSMHERLNEAMIHVVRINRDYKKAFLVILAAVAFVVSVNTVGWLTAATLSLLILCLFYKTYEFFNNKFCFVDVQIVLVYKRVLDKLNSAKI